MEIPTTVTPVVSGAIPPVSAATPGYDWTFVALIVCMIAIVWTGGPLLIATLLRPRGTVRKYALFGNLIAFAALLGVGGFMLARDWGAIDSLSTWLTDVNGLLFAALLVEALMISGWAALSFLMRHARQDASNQRIERTRQR